MPRETHHGAAPRACPMPVVLGVAALLTACTTGGVQAPSGTDTAAAPVPPPPPAACVLDAAALATGTGLVWTPNALTASDTRCVYDAAGADPLDFIGVDVAPFTGPAAAELTALAGVCDDGSRSDVPAGEGAFVCRYKGGSVFSALVADGKVTTVVASAVPAGTTAERLAATFTAELNRIGGR